MIHNPVIDAMMARKSIRKYTDQKPSDEVIETIVKAGQQAPFAGQLCSMILTRNEKLPFKAPLMFTICVDYYRLEKIMEKRNWKTVTNDLSLLVFGMQDASLMGENMVIAAESLGLGSCYLGMAPYVAGKLSKKHKLPKHVWPMVQLVIGYPDENPPPRPRYPLDFSMFEDEYPEITDEKMAEAMKVMDEGYRSQNYYKSMNAKIPIEVEKEETFDYSNYSWTEHMSRKWGQ
ncbi:MAG: hypothetical protein GY865_19465, partial [candidate division Zixibacteria bacterium]|nr:hypothetical protein [candidate division Zixibacteria bacterium]